MLANKANSNPLQLAGLAFRWILYSFDSRCSTEEEVGQSVFEIIGQKNSVALLILVQQLEEAGDTLCVKPLS